MGTWNSRDRETVSGTDFGDRISVVADSSRNPLSTRSMWRATGADGTAFARRYWLSPNSANAWPRCAALARFTDLREQRQWVSIAGHGILIDKAYAGCSRIIARIQRASSTELPAE